MKERLKKETKEEQESADVPIIINPGFGGPLLITHNGSARSYRSNAPLTDQFSRLVGQAPGRPNGTGIGMISVGYFPSTLRIRRPSSTLTGFGSHLDVRYHYFRISIQYTLVICHAVGRMPYFRVLSLMTSCDQIL
jgi:hypothetical protein